MQKQIKRLKWSSLKVTMLPIIAIQVQYAIQLLQGYHKKIKNQIATVDQVNTYNQLYSGIQHQILLLDSFYKTYINDETISLFHMLKIKLKRAIFLKQKVQLKKYEQKKDLILQKNDSFVTSNWNYKDSLFQQPYQFNLDKQNQFMKVQDDLHASQIVHSNQSRSFKHQSSNNRIKSRSPLHANNLKSLKQDVKRQTKTSVQASNIHLNLKTSINVPTNANQKQLSKSYQDLHKSKQLTKQSTIKSFKQTKKQPTNDRQIVKQNNRQIIGKQRKTIQVGKLPKQQILATQKPYAKGQHTINKVSQNSAQQIHNNTKIKIQEKLMSEPIQIKEQQKIAQNNQFRFTIKMNRQEYQQLLDMKKKLLNKPIKNQ